MYERFHEFHVCSIDKVEGIYSNSMVETELNDLLFRLWRITESDNMKLGQQ